MAHNFKKIIPRKAINKSSKTLFFVPFLVVFACWGFFPKIPALPHTTISGPRKVSKKTDEPIPRKFTDRWKDGWTEGRKDRTIS